MTSASRTARACRAAAWLLLLCAGYCATYNPVLALPGLVGVGIFASCAAGYRAEERRARARYEQLARAWHADEQALQEPDVRQQLDEGCCERWWTSLGAEHDRGCAAHARRSAA